MASVEFYDGMNPQVLEYPIADSTLHGSFLAGDLVTVTTAGYLKKASVAIKFLGIARKNYSNDSTTKIPVELINVNSIYSVRWSSTATTATSQALVGDAVSFSFTAGAHTVSSTGTASAYVVGLDPRDGTGASGGRLLIRFYGTALTTQTT